MRMGVITRAWTLAAAVAALCCACERAGPAPAAAPEIGSEVIAPQPDAVALADPTAPEAVGVPPFAPIEPQPDLALPPIPGEGAPASPPRRAPTPRQKTDIAAAVAEPAVDHPSLDSLLRAPDPPPPAPKPLDLAPPPAAAAPQPKPAPGALDRLGQNIRLERRKEPIGVAGPRQGTLYETEAGLRIPVDSAVSLEGGVRMDTREEPGQEEPDRRSTPRVGVEVRF
jgi:hypothetical protein